MKTWPSRFDAARAALLANNPQGIANEVCNGRMGNRVGSNDGWTYRGHGGSQVTGHDGYDKLGQKVGLDLLNNPDLVNAPSNFLECAVADFILCGCLPFAQNDDVAGVAFHLDGGYIGLPERKSWLAKWEAALNVFDACGARNLLGAAIAEQTRCRAATDRRRLIRPGDGCCGSVLSEANGSGRRRQARIADHRGDRAGACLIGWRIRHDEAIGGA
jgi:hypothetical protein